MCNAHTAPQTCFSPKHPERRVSKQSAAVAYWGHHSCGLELHAAPRSYEQLPQPAPRKRYLRHREGKRLRKCRRVGGDDSNPKPKLGSTAWLLDAFLRHSSNAQSWTDSPESSREPRTPPPHRKQRSLCHRHQGPQKSTGTQPPWDTASSGEERSPTALGPHV